MTNKHILLTGGTGLIGKGLTQRLLQAGHHVSHLSRSPSDIPNVKTFLWNVKKGEIDSRCTDGVDIIIHLAGAGIADKRWTAKRKKEIVDSRTRSISLIYDLLARQKHSINSIISASGIAWYGNAGDELMTEDTPPAHDYLAQCCVEWEAAVDKGLALGLRTVKFRTGVVLAKKGALAKLAIPVKLYVGSPLGSGRQWVPWVHLQDVIDMYISAVENDALNGVYNMVAPNPVTNKQLTQAVAKQLHKPLWAPRVPAFVLKIIMGEMSTVVLGSTKVSAQKIEDAGFRFQFTTVEQALKEIYG